MEAHRAAVDAALAYMERAACWARRGKGGADSSPATASSPPPTSTAPPAPATPSSTPTSSSPTRPSGPDGRWSRLYHPAIYEHAKTASYIYEAHLRHELTQRLGVEWEPVVNGIADIGGFAPEQLRASPPAAPRSSPRPARTPPPARCRSPPWRPARPRTAT